MSDILSSSRIQTPKVMSIKDKSNNVVSVESYMFSSIKTPIYQPFRLMKYNWMRYDPKLGYFELTRGFYKFSDAGQTIGRPSFTP